MAVLVNRPFERGGMLGAVSGQSVPEWAAEFEAKSWGQFFLKYVLSHPAVTCPIPATSDPGHLRDNMGAGLGRVPDEAERRRMAQFVEGLREARTPAAASAAMRVALRSELSIQDEHHLELVPRLDTIQHSHP